MRILTGESECKFRKASEMKSGQGERKKWMGEGGREGSQISLEEGRGYGQPRIAISGISIPAILLPKLLRRIVKEILSRL